MSISDRREFLKPVFLLNKVKRSMGQFKKLFTVAIIHYSMLEKLYEILLCKDLDENCRRDLKYGN